ncbi:MAG: hypothetical protein IIC67_08115 [Thaumarchaeota archaeon]|nr:hypothetical protein [Nitrososphaerota archaeon]
MTSIFKVRDESITNAEIDRQMPTPKCNVTITPVDFKSEVVEVKTPVVKDPIVIPPTSSFDPFPPTIRSRIRDKFQGIRPNLVENFLIQRQRRFQ